ncbi:hypothetical protein FHX57_006754 [Paraburkholderia tropica]|nr:hypothetical protein [Paraburkholderia tropica]
MMSCMPPPPPPMPNIKAARLATDDLVKAAGRANQAWTKAQMRDALRSVRYWLELAEQSIEDDEHPDRPNIPQPQGFKRC